MECRMKKIFLYAYDNVNLGDDLFIETIVNRYPDTKFYFWTDCKNKQVFNDLKNLKIIKKNSAGRKLLKKISPSLEVRYKTKIQNKCDAQVYIGGSIFIEYPTWKNIAAWWDFQSRNYPFYVVGANFGPYQTEEYRTAMDKVYRQLKDICFRDTYSKKLFDKNQKVRQAPDILFSYPMPKSEVSKKQVFISVISYKEKELNWDFDQMTNEEYLGKMAQMTEGFLKQGYRIILASFCRQEGDLKAAEEIKERISHQQQNIYILDYNGRNRTKILNEMSASAYIIAARFHGTILAMAAEKPVFPIIYSDKMKYVLEDLGFRGSYADLRNPESLCFENAKGNLESDDILNVKKLAEASQKHFEKLDEL